MKRTIAPAKHIQKVQFLCPARRGEGSFHFLFEDNVDEIFIVVSHLVLDPVILNAVHQQSVALPDKGGEIMLKY